MVTARAVVVAATPTAVPDHHPPVSLDGATMRLSFPCPRSGRKLAVVGQVGEGTMDHMSWQVLTWLLAGAAAIVVLWSLIQAAILKWRARKVKAITISFGKAFYVSIMAWCAAIAFSFAASIALALGNITNEAVGLTARLCTLVVWYYAHSKLLARATASSAALSPKEARAITSDVFAVMIVIAIAVAALFMLGNAFL